MSEDPIQAFRALSPESQAKEGEDSLLAHILERACLARAKYPSLGMDCLDRFLADTDCVRYPARFVFEFGSEMAPHQFAQPEPDFRSENPQAKVIYLRPILQNKPHYAIAAIAYMIPLINYGEIVRDEHCLVFAAALLGLSEEECYSLICEIADYCGSELRYAPCQEKVYSGCSCSSGCK